MAAPAKSPPRSNAANPAASRATPPPTQSASPAAPAPLFSPAELGAVAAIAAKLPAKESPLVLEPAFTVPAGQSANIGRTLVALLDGAKSEILVNAYAITDREIVYALTRARSFRGVSVIALLEPAPAIQNYRTPAYLTENNVQVAYSRCKGFNHNSYIVVDRTTVVTGSYQFTQSSATQNAENILFLRHPRTALRYYEAFARHLNESIIPESQLLKNPHTVRDMTVALTRSIE